MSFHPNDVRRRGIAANVIVAGVLVLLGAGFFRTQVLEHDEYRLQSETNRLREVPLPAPRGVIYDRKGEVIAENAVSYNVSMLAKNEGERVRGQADDEADHRRHARADAHGGQQQGDDEEVGRGAPGEQWPEGVVEEDEHRAEKQGADGRAPVHGRAPVVVSRRAESARPAARRARAAAESAGRGAVGAGVGRMTAAPGTACTMESATAAPSRPAESR